MTAYLYAAKDSEGLCKIGVCNDMERRWRGLSPPGGRRGKTLTLLGVWRMPVCARPIELEVRWHYKPHRVPGGEEWFEGLVADDFLAFVTDMAESNGGVSASTVQNFLKAERKRKPRKYLNRRRS